MKRLLLTFAAACLATLALAAPAQAAFGIRGFDVAFTNEDGTSVTKAGEHPFAVTVSLGANFDEGTLIPEGWLRNLFVDQAPGFIGDTTAYQRCSTAQYLESFEGNFQMPGCALETQVGVAGVSLENKGDVSWIAVPVFNVTPPPGVLLRLGFRTITQNTFIDVTLNQDPPYNAIASSSNVPQIFPVFGSKIELWGDPSDPLHNELRRGCGLGGNSPPPGDIAAFEFKGTSDTCSVAKNTKPFLTLPTNCSQSLPFTYEATSWDIPPATDSGGIVKPAMEGCGNLNFKPTIDSKPTSRAASSPTGLDFVLQMQDEGLTSATGRAASQMRKAVVTLPEGMTVNPSQAEGLEVCSEEDLEDETLAAEPGDGCPQASKIGTVEVQSPLVEEPIDGSLFVAEPHRNLAEDSLIAVYLVIKNRNLGIVVKQPIKVTPDPKTGQLITTADNVPQLPFSSFRLHFREGGRSPLVTPPGCDSFETVANLYPWSGNSPVEQTSTFQILSGPNEGPCPTGSTPPFEPGFEAGSESNAAGRYSPFSMRLTRRDGDQDLTRFDATLPPGVSAKLAGVDRCSDAQIALAKAKTGIAEQNSPSCPLNSRIGEVIGGAGVGSQLTYVKGDIYLAGPFGGAPLSVVAIVPAVAGPFDVGTVVTRQALVVDPRTGVVTADGAHSDPIPHILAGIPLVVRDIQVHVDRSGFALNPTSCDPFATKAQIWGGGSNVFSSLDDSPAHREARYQAASCASLGFKPNLQLKLKGGTKRGGHPRLRGTFKPRSGDANLKGLVLRLPRSAFLDQAHIRTICTRVQFAASGGNGAGCPAAAIYGRVRAFTPILSEPLEGPVFLRSSNHNLPDFVAALHGLVDIEAVARIDSKKGGIRATFTDTPDAPLSKVVVEMQGGKKGLIVNSTNLCGSKHRANAEFDGHNGKSYKADPVVGAGCGKR